MECEHCKHHESAAPAHRNGDGSESSVVPGAAFTCPMHPEVMSAEPGACPLCGMALESTVPGVEDESELIDMRRRLWVSTVFTVPVFALSMLDAMIDGGVGVSAATLNIVLMVLATPVILYGARPFFERAVQSVKNRAPNMFTLIGLGVAVAYVYSVAATVVPDAFPHAFRMDGGAVGTYFETSAVIVTLVLAGQVIELRARGRAGQAVQQLLELAPAVAVRVGDDGVDREVELADVEVGDRLRVRPGGKVPADGVVVDGSGVVDESMVTGEPVAVAKSIGDQVIGATLNEAGSFVMEVRRAGADTVLSRIIHLVADAQRSRAPIQRLADRVAEYFVPAVIAVAVVSALIWALVGPDPRAAHALLAAVSVLIIACPCALGLATPMSITVAMGRGASLGVLFRDAAAVESLRSVDTLIVDKTGTLTEGHPRVAGVDAAEAESEDRVLAVAAALERGSEHPLARAVEEAATTRSIDIPTVEEFHAEPGKGVFGRVDGTEALLGSQTFMAERRMDVSGIGDAAAAAAQRGETVVFVAVAGQCIGLVRAADDIKQTTPRALASLRARDIDIVMATGDHSGAANVVAEALGIGTVHAGVGPEDKAALVEQLESTGKRVAMAGDGINDAPALARATVGIAMGDGTDIAMESAHVALVKGDLRGVDQAIALSHATIRNVRQNLVFAFGYNVLGIPVAAGVLYPFAGALLSPMIAAAAMSFSSVSVILNALRLRRVRI